jgi:hypothetical protein
VKEIHRKYSRTHGICFALLLGVLLSVGACHESSVPLSAPMAKPLYDRTLANASVDLINDSYFGKRLISTTGLPEGQRNLAEKLAQFPFTDVWVDVDRPTVCGFEGSCPSGEESLLQAFPDLEIIDVYSPIINSIQSKSVNSFVLPENVSREDLAKWLSRLKDPARSPLPQLRHIALRGHEFVSAEELIDGIASIPTIESVELQADMVNTKDIERLSRMKQLRGVALISGHKLQVQDIDCLHQLKQLTHLMIYCDTPEEITSKLKEFTNLQELHLHGKQFTNVCLADLANLPNLRVLVIDDTSVTDAGILELKGMGKLEVLSACHTDVSVDAMAQWMQANPQFRHTRANMEFGRVIDGWIHGLHGNWFAQYGRIAEKTRQHKSTNNETRSRSEQE